MCIACEWIDTTQKLGYCCCLKFDDGGKTFPNENFMKCSFATCANPPPFSLPPPPFSSFRPFSGRKTLNMLVCARVCVHACTTCVCVCVQAKVSRLWWVLQECVSRPTSDFATTRHLLSYGLSRTSFRLEECWVLVKG